MIGTRGVSGPMSLTKQLEGVALVAHRSARSAVAWMQGRSLRNEGPKAAWAPSDCFFAPGQVQREIGSTGGGAGNQRELVCVRDASESTHGAWRPAVQRLCHDKGSHWTGPLLPGPAGRSSFAARDDIASGPGFLAGCSVRGTAPDWRVRCQALRY
jgi:hypothetical protein